MAFAKSKVTCKCFTPLLMLLLVLASSSVKAQSEKEKNDKSLEEITQWYANPDDMGYYHVGPGDSISILSHWTPSTMSFHREVAFDTVSASIGPGWLRLQHNVNVDDYMKDDRLDIRSSFIEFQHQSMSRLGISKEGLRLNDDIGSKVARLFSSRNGGNLKLYANGNQEDALVNIGPTEDEDGTFRGSVQVADTDGIPKANIRVDDQGRGNVTTEIISSNPGDPLSSLHFESNGSYVIDMDKDGSSNGNEQLVVKSGGRTLMYVSESGGATLSKTSNGVIYPHLSIRDISTGGYARISMGNLDARKWQIAADPNGDKKIMIFHLTSFNGQAGSDKMTLDGGGDLWIAGTLTEESDRRLKSNIVQMSGSLEKVTNLNGYNYHWKDSEKSKSLQSGVMAQEVQEIFPELVHTNANGDLSVNYSGLIPHLIEAVKELNARVKELESESKR